MRFFILLKGVLKLGFVFISRVWFSYFFDPYLTIVLGFIFPHRYDLGRDSTVGSAALPLGGGSGGAFKNFGHYPVDQPHRS